MIRLFVDHDLQQFDAEIAYVLDFIENHPYAKQRIKFVNSPQEAEKNLNYRPKSDLECNIPSQKILFSKACVDNHQLFPNQYIHQGETLYSVEENDKSPIGNFVINADDRILMAFDVFEAIFFHISRYEERNINSVSKDSLGRVNESELFLVRFGLEQIPVVDRLIYHFLKCLSIAPVIGTPKKIITHDIDHTKAFKHFPGLVKRIAKMGLNNMGWSMIRKVWKAYSEVVNGKKEDPFAELRFLSNSSHVEKHLFLLVGGDHNLDTPRDLKSAEVNSILQKAIMLNYNIGIHPSIESSMSDELSILLSEIDLLKKSMKQGVENSRSHYLCFDIDATPRKLEMAGIKRDFTLGYHSHIGFRAGTSVDYHLFDFSNRKKFELLSTPLIVMDTAIWHFADKSPMRFKETWNDFHKNTKSYIQICYNFHNSSFFDFWCFGLNLWPIYESISRENQKSAHNIKS